MLAWIDSGQVQRQQPTQEHLDRFDQISAPEVIFKHPLNAIHVSQCKICPLDSGDNGQASFWPRTRISDVFDEATESARINRILIVQPFVSISAPTKSEVSMVKQAYRNAQ